MKSMKILSIVSSVTSFEGNDLVADDARFCMVLRLRASSPTTWWWQSIEMTWYPSCWNAKQALDHGQSYFPRIMRAEDGNLKGIDS